MLKVEPTWQIVATRDFKYDCITLAELRFWIEENVPKGTKDENIRLELNVNETSGYYDDIIVDVALELSVLK